MSDDRDKEPGPPPQPSPEQLYPPPPIPPPAAQMSSDERERQTLQGIAENYALHEKAKGIRRVALADQRDRNNLLYREQIPKLIAGLTVAAVLAYIFPVGD